jgi:hypothetical protein
MCTEAPKTDAVEKCKDCPCLGGHNASIDGVSPISSYSGDLPSPYPLYWYATGTGNGPIKIDAMTIRAWTKEASKYHGVPYLLSALILQQENGPNATEWQKRGQFAERSATTFAAIMDEWFFDVVPDRIAGSSSGIANLSRATLRSAAEYIESNYCRPIIPDDVRNRLRGWSQDTRIPGDDLRADLYYMTGHLRELIDRITGKKCFDGPLTVDQVQKIAAAYNGSGPKAEKYGKDAIERIKRAEAGTEPLYFYE